MQRNSVLHSKTYPSVNSDLYKQTKVKITEIKEIYSNPYTI